MVNKEQLYEIYNKYHKLKTTNQEKAAYYLLNNTKNLLKLGKFGMNIRKEYEEEATTYIQMDIVRAFDSYQPDKGASLWTWVYRLMIQSQYKFIQAKTSQNKKTCFDFSYETTPEVYDIEIDEPDPEQQAITNDKATRYSNDLYFILSNIFSDKLTMEIYCRLNGVLNFPQQSLDEIAEDTRLSVESVSTLKKKAQNELFYFRKWCKDWELSFDNICYTDVLEYRRNRKTKI